MGTLAQNGYNAIPDASLRGRIPASGAPARRSTMPSETVRKTLLERCDLHTLLRLPTGIFSAQGGVASTHTCARDIRASMHIKTNVIFFDAKPAFKTAWT